MIPYRRGNLAQLHGFNNADFDGARQRGKTTLAGLSPASVQPKILDTDKRDLPRFACDLAKKL
jgi:hypothetical protein